MQSDYSYNNEEAMLVMTVGERQLLRNNRYAFLIHSEDVIVNHQAQTLPGLSDVGGPGQ
jgi:hypothetical protein